MFAWAASLQTNGSKAPGGWASKNSETQEEVLL